MFREAIELSITKYFKSGQITKLRTKITFKHRSKRVKLTNITLITEDRFEALKFSYTFSGGRGKECWGGGLILYPSDSECF